MKLKLLLIFLLLPVWGMTQNLIPYLKNDKYGFSDEEGNVVIDPIYDEVSLFTSKV